MKSKKAHEGYFEIDHRLSPGNDQVGEGHRFECATITCGHCQRVVLLNPERRRTRFHCRKCDNYICDCCGDPLITGCLDFNALLDQLQEDAFLKLNVKEI